MFFLILEAIEEAFKGRPLEGRLKKFERHVKLALELEGILPYIDRKVPVGPLDNFLLYRTTQEDEGLVREYLQRKGISFFVREGGAWFEDFLPGEKVFIVPLPPPPKTLIFCDFDGCVVYRGRIETRALETLEWTLKEMNAEIIFISGRPFPLLQALQFFFPNCKYVVGENGAVVFSINGGKYRKELLVERKKVEALWCFKKQIKRLASRTGLFTVEPGKKYSFSIHPSSGVELEKVERIIRRLLPPELEAVRTADSIDVFPQGAGKDVAVRYLLERIPADVLVYVGDSANDIKAANVIKSLGGTVIAPENVTPAFRPYADIVGKGFGLRGVVDALETLEKIL